MPVSLDDMMKEFSAEDQAEIKRAASGMVADYRQRMNLGASEPKRGPLRIAVGTTAQTGQRCPGSGIWKVENTDAVIAPIAIDDLMPPYGSRAVTWVLIEYA